MPLTETQYLPFHRACIEQEEIDAVVRVLQSGWLTTGPITRRFESEFAQAQIDARTKLRLVIIGSTTTPFLSS